MARFNPADHPRYPNGKFRPKFSHGLRLSPISASYSAGFRVPVVPGRANLYVGALARVEASQGSRLLKKQTDRAVNAVARRFGDNKGTSHLAQVLKGDTVHVRGLNVQGPRNVIKAPTFRVSSTPASRAPSKVRSPNRRPRTRRAARARTPNLSSSVSAQPTLVNPRRAIKTDTSGRKVRSRSRKASRRR